MSWEDVVTNAHKGWAQPTKGLARTELNGIFDWYDNDEKWERENGV